jgi:hypothetical protein
MTLSVSIIILFIGCFIAFRFIQYGHMRWWRLRTLAELMLPPHRICPLALEHVTLSQWRGNADDYFSPQNKGTIFEWLEAKSLPPIPKDRFCYEEMRWIHNMGPMAKEAYLKQLREGKIIAEGK